MLDFVNPWVIAAYIVASVLVTVKLQFQAIIFLWVVIYAVQDFNQFALVSLILVVSVVVGKFRAAAAASG